MDKPLTNPFVDRPAPMGSLLGAAWRRVTAEIDERLADAGFGDVRAAHAPVFMSIEAEGSSISSLADALGTTKQSTGELVRHLERQGYVTVSVNPSDRRGRLVQLTDRGWQALEVGQGVVMEFDAWLAGVVGAARVRRLREDLARIAAWSG